MNHKQKLLNIYNSSFSISETELNSIPANYRQLIEVIGKQAYEQKAVFTVLITLLIHKLLHPEQDIRKHQAKMAGGFAARIIDTQLITPTLKELELPSMAESGWLTRSLEQPHPYNLDYPGKIRNTTVKEAFLNILDQVQKEPKQAEVILKILINTVIQVKNKNVLLISPLTNPDISIPLIASYLKEHFYTNYGTHGGAKLPVLAIYAMYKSLISEVKRYENCTLASLGSHTASDLTSKTSGDIEVKDFQKQLLEVVEVKSNIEIDLNRIRIVYEKIKRFNPRRYYVLSDRDIKSSEREEIEKLIENIGKQHGCQVIINGIIPTIKYYLRLISLDKFITDYSELVKSDSELKFIHKRKWSEIIEKVNSS
ncbi:hypothetical protein [Floridanema aerugineum]|uniref:Uncharacterized protein n=1 Tax=Floridaenema aerugineum BLCC-F46 TaxID=3153654 RepID=A0ABV4X6J6_9CYAN